jgi:hypothetical protein
MSVIDDPTAVLAEAFQRLAESSCWTMTARPDHFHLEAAVRPGLQWQRMEGLFGGDEYAVLIRDDAAYLYGGMWQASMLGYTRSSEEIGAVVGDRWLRCNARAFLRAGADHGVLEQVAKLARPFVGEQVTVHRMEPGVVPCLHRIGGDGSGPGRADPDPSEATGVRVKRARPGILSDLVGAAGAKRETLRRWWNRQRQ